MKTTLHCAILVALPFLFACKKEIHQESQKDPVAGPVLQKSENKLVIDKEVKDFLKYLDGLTPQKREIELNAFIQKRNGATQKIAQTQSINARVLNDDPPIPMEDFVNFWYYGGQLEFVPGGGGNHARTINWQVVENAWQFWRVKSRDHLEATDYAEYGGIYTMNDHVFSYIEGTTAGIIGWAELAHNNGYSGFTAYSYVEGRLVSPLYDMTIYAEKFIPISEAIHYMP